MDTIFELLLLLPGSNKVQRLALNWKKIHLNEIHSVHQIKQNCVNLFCLKPLPVVTVDPPPSDPRHIFQANVPSDEVPIVRPGRQS